MMDVVPRLIHIGRLINFEKKNSESNSCMVEENFEILRREWTQIDYILFLFTNYIISS